MRVVIAGGGNVGTFIADDLVQPATTSRSSRGPGRGRAEPPARRADRRSRGSRPTPARSTSSRAAELEQADVVAAVTGDDEDNLVISLLAKQEFAVPRVVARVNNPKNEWMFNETWGVDVSVSTPHLLTALVEEAVSVGTLRPAAVVRGRQGPAGRGDLADGSPAAGKEIVELGFPATPRSWPILREDHVIVPRGDTVLHIGDEVLVLVTDESEAAVRAVLVGA